LASKWLRFEDEPRPATGTTLQAWASARQFTHSMGKDRETQSLWNQNQRPKPQFGYGQGFGWFLVGNLPRPTSIFLSPGPHSFAVEALWDPPGANVSVESGRFVSKIGMG
jgi:hypothetical protein